MRRRRTVFTTGLALVLVGQTAFAQAPFAQAPLREAAAAPVRSALSAATQVSRRRPLVVAGTILAGAGGAAVVLGLTAVKSAASTSGNTPPGAYAQCVALRANPVYRDSDCEALKGPNRPLVIGGAVVAAAGVTLVLVGLPSSSLTFAPGAVVFRQRLTF